MLNENPSLRNCKACGSKISRHSLFCRHCGHPQTGVLARWLIAGLAVLLLVLFVASFFLLHFVSAICGSSG
jgi:hypothetical protein